MKTPFSIVVAIDENFGIGRNNALPWNLPGDMKHFKEVTTENTDGRPNLVIMGRKTWESIPEKFRPLPGRINCVLSRDPGFTLPNGVIRATDFEQALAMANHPPLKDKVGGVYVIGGGEIFRTALEHSDCRKLYITHIQKSFDCDRIFPPLPPAFVEKIKSPIFKEGGISYFFSIYVRF